MERQRLFFVAVVGAILVVLAIFAVILLVLGDEEDQGEDSGPDASPESAGLVAPPWAGSPGVVSGA